LRPGTSMLRRTILVGLLAFGAAWALPRLVRDIRTEPAGRLVSPGLETAPQQARGSSTSIPGQWVASRAASPPSRGSSSSLAPGAKRASSCSNTTGCGGLLLVRTECGARPRATIAPRRRFPPHSTCHQVEKPSGRRRPALKAPSRTPGHRDTGTPGHRDTGTPGHRDTGTPGHRDTRTPGHPDTRTPGHRDTGTPGHPDTRTPGHPDTRTPERPLPPVRGAAENATGSTGWSSCTSTLAEWAATPGIDLELGP
jgi:hypothetical protein